MNANIDNEYVLHPTVSPNCWHDTLSLGRKAADPEMNFALLEATTFAFTA